MATLEQWRDLERWAEVPSSSFAACILELRAKVEALEAAANDRPMPSAPSADELVQRVAATLHAVTNSDPNVPANEWTPEARAAIREVAAAARSKGYVNASLLIDWLEREGDRG